MKLEKTKHFLFLEWVEWFWKYWKVQLPREDYGTQPSSKATRSSHPLVLTLGREVGNNQRETGETQKIAVQEMAVSV